MIGQSSYSLADRKARMMVLVGLVAVASLSLIPLAHRIDRSGAMHMAATSTGPGAQAARPTTTVRPISCQKLADIPGKSVSTVMVDFPPGAYTPRHRHPGSVTAFVLKGTLRSQLAGGPVQIFAAGQSWFEPLGAIHLFAENASPTEPAELLAIFIADDDCGPLTIPD